MDAHTLFTTYLNESINVLQACLGNDTLKNSVNAVADILIDAAKTHKPILIFGNGGSASDAEHFAAELVCRYRINRRSVNAIALSHSGALATAISNDLGYEHVFSRQVEGLAHEGGVCIGLTTSGTSKNIIKALHMAQQKGMTSIALIGEHTTAIAPYTHHIISVPCGITSLIQQAHLVIYHHLCDAVEKSILEG